MLSWLKARMAFTLVGETKQRDQEQKGFGKSAARSKSDQEEKSHLKLYKLQVAPLRDIGKLKDAEPVLNLLLQARTRVPEVYRDLAELAQECGDSEQATHWLETWLNQASNRPESLWEQGRTAEELGRHQQALDHYQHLLKLQPRHLGALQHASRLLLRTGAFQQAIVLVRNWINQSPCDVEGRLTLAACFLENQRIAEAEEEMKSLEGVMVEAPWLSLSEAVRARLLQQQGDEPKALQLAIELLDVTDDTTRHWMVHRLLAPLLLKQQRLDLLQQALGKAIHLQPNQADLHGIEAECLLLQGELQAGYTAFDRRERLLRDGHKYLDHGCSLPRWEVVSLREPLVLIASGTLGDTMLLSRYGPWLQHRLQTAVQLFVQPPILTLLRDALGDQISVQDFSSLHQQRQGGALPLTSLPGLFGSCEEHKVLRHPHLKANPTLIDYWRQRLNLYEGEILLGINWHGSALQALSEQHSGDIPLSILEPLSRIPRVRLLSLQKGIGLEQLDVCNFRDRFVNVQNEITSEQRMEHLAALISLCRYVVTDDSGPAHLAGCLGVPGVVLLPERINWRWGSHGHEGLAWYPSLRLLRKAAGESWSDLVEKAKLWLEGEQKSRQCDDASKLGP
jgi:tetratricopeptide (TPR) repeat protein